ncbi:hypothetical protein Q7P37_008411 [Cladosporium fusiforme]
MEALAALSVAGHVFQFLGLGLKTLNLCRQIQKSEKGATENNEEIQQCVTEMEELQKSLHQGHELRGTNPQETIIIDKARQDCTAAAREILQLLDDIKAGGKNRSCEALRAALRAHKSRRKIEALQKRLDNSNSRLQSALTFDTRNKIIQILGEEGKCSEFLRTTVVPEIQQLHDENVASHAKIQEQTSRIAAGQDSLNRRMSSMRNQDQAAEDAIMGGQDKLGAQLSEQSNQTRLETLRKNFLELSFPDMFQRHESIHPPSTGTYEWIFQQGTDEEATSSRSVTGENQVLRGKFWRWLCSDGPIFWINGKPASGKSCLMSYIEDQRDGRLKQGLQQWSGSRKLHIFSHFFWRPGSELQKSITGLLRTLLFQMIKENPSIADEIVAQAPGDGSWTEMRLLRILEKFIEAYQNADDCMFLLVDGLDEFEGDYTELLKAILKVGTNRNTKMCLSSRPEAVLISRLEAYPSIRLQDLNFNDVERSVQSKFDDAGFTLEIMARDVALYAEGVFLWAVLVSKQLIEGHASCEDRATLQKRLHAFPRGLENLFDHLFSSIDRIHRDFLNLMFQMLIHEDVYKKYRDPIALVVASRCQSRIATLEHFCKSCDEMQRQTSAQSKGLIETDSERGRKFARKYQIQRAWAIWDISTGARSKNSIQDVASISALALRNSSIRWVHRSAHDYVSGNSDAVVPGWIRSQKTDITKELLNGFRWLAKFAPSIVLCGEIDSQSTNPSGHYCISDFDEIPRAISNLTHGGTVSIQQEGYQLMDDIWDDLSSSLNLLNLNDEESAHFQVPFRDFWFGLAFQASTHYFELRFERLLSGPFALEICQHILEEVTLAQQVPSVMPQLLDFLIARTKSLSNAASDMHVRAYTYTTWEHNDCRIISLLKQNRQHRWEIATATEISKLAVDGTPAISTRWWTCVEHRETRRTCAKLAYLLKKWGVALCNPSGDENAFLLPMQMQLISATLFDFMRSKTDIFGFRLMILQGGIRAPEPYKEDRSYSPICTFDLDHATNKALSEALKLSWWDETGFPRFCGSKEAFKECLGLLLRNVENNVPPALDEHQQRYVRDCIEDCFGKLWTFGEVEDAREYVSSNEVIY